MRDYYKILGIDRNISQKDLKKHYYRLAKKYHPDTANNNKKEILEIKFKEITEAYNALSTAEKRNRYNTRGMGGNFVYSNGFSTRSSVPKKERILTKLKRNVDFSIKQFAAELRVSYSNLKKILIKFIQTLDINANIENEHVVFKV